MKCDTCDRYSAIVRTYRNKTDGVYCDNCYIDFLLKVRDNLKPENSLEELQREAKYTSDGD